MIEGKVCIRRGSFRKNISFIDSSVGCIIEQDTSRSNKQAATLGCVTRIDCGNMLAQSTNQAIQVAVWYIVHIDREQVARLQVESMGSSSIDDHRNLVVAYTIA